MRSHFAAVSLTPLPATIVRASLLAAGFFSKGLYDERLVIANANGVGRVEKKARQSGMAMSRPIPL